MSGGHFNHDQYRMRTMSEDIESLIHKNKTPDEYGYMTNFSPETLAKFREAADILRVAEEMVQRIDWLVSGDDGEDTFHERWLQTVLPLKNKKPEEIPLPPPVYNPEDPYSFAQKMIDEKTGEDIGEHVPDKVLCSIGLDDLDVKELIMSIEDAFDVDLPDDAITGNSTIQDVVDLCAKQMEAKKIRVYNI